MAKLCNCNLLSIMDVQPNINALDVPSELGKGTILDRWRLADGTLYMDNAATRPMLPEIADRMARLMGDTPLNASSRHRFGQKSRSFLEDSRAFISAEINAPSGSRLVFNSGATEGVTAALTSVFLSQPGKNHIITATTEHKAVLNTCSFLESAGADVTYLNVDEFGQISLDELREVIRPTTCAVCLLWVNNETGSIFPLRKIGDICNSSGVRLLVDATQALVKFPIDLVELNGIDVLVGSAHKIGGPIGVGLIWARKPQYLIPMMHGGGQEFGKRAGTLNIAGIQGFRAAWEKFDLTTDDCVKAKEELERLLSGEVEFISLGNEASSPFICVARALNGREKFMMRSDICVSAGSACSEGLLRDSHVYSRIFEGASDIIRFSF